MLDEGRRSGQVRTDIAISEMLDFLVEQTYLAASNGSSGEYLSRSMEVEEGVSAASGPLYAAPSICSI